MRYSLPSTDAQKAYYRKFGGSMSTASTARRVTQYLLWLPVAAAAMASILSDFLGKYMTLPFVYAFAVCLAVAFMLHRLLSATAQASLYDMLDNDPKTNSWAVAPIVLSLFLGYLEYKATSGWLVGTVAVPTEITDASETDYSTALADAETRYSLEKQRVTENYSDRYNLAAPSLVRKLDDLRAQRKRAKTSEDKAYLNALIAKAERELDTNSALRKLREAEGNELAALLDAHNTEKQRLAANRDKAALVVAGKNGAAIAEYQDKTATANRGAGLISVFCLVLFWWAYYREIKIKCESGILPNREFTPLQAHGNAFEKLVEVLGDVFSRNFHATIYSYHSRSLRGMKELHELDSPVVVTAPPTELKNGRVVEWESPGKN